ncbi:DUF983 domain-containing protein [Methylocella sp.]|jgi:uncharacterized protein (DUF983 family)|uniref:DUF983 domain-containing protein n=1 Tax=Methylocella sp. TaxID=1978226 RepID=UPI003C20EDF8
MGDGDHSQTSAFVAGLTGRCPRCGRGALFKGFAALAPACDVCGLDYGFADSADGPAVFISLIGGFIVLGAALWTELVFEPPMWVHMAVFLPLTAIVCLGLLRPLKGLLVARQYQTQAEEGRLKR